MSLIKNIIIFLPKKYKSQVLLHQLIRCLQFPEQKFYVSNPNLNIYEQSILIHRGTKKNINKLSADKTLEIKSHQPSAPGLPPITAALPLEIRDLAMVAIKNLPSIVEKIKAIQHLEKVAGISLPLCRWSDDIKYLYEKRQNLEASLLLDTSLRSLLQIPEELSFGTMGETISLN